MRDVYFCEKVKYISASAMLERDWIINVGNCRNQRIPLLDSCASIRSVGNVALENIYNFLVIIDIDKVAAVVLRAIDRGCVNCLVFVNP